MQTLKEIIETLVEKEGPAPVLSALADIAADKVTAGDTHARFWMQVHTKLLRLAKGIA